MREEEGVELWAFSSHSYLCFASFPMFSDKNLQSEGDFSMQQTGGLEFGLASSSSPSQFQDYKMMVPGDSYGT